MPLGVWSAPGKLSLEKLSTFHQNPNYFELFLTDFLICMFFCSAPTTRRVIHSETTVGASEDLNCDVLISFSSFRGAGGIRDKHLRTFKLCKLESLTSES